MFSTRTQRIAASAAAAVGIALGAAGISAAATSTAAPTRPAVHKSAPAEGDAGKPDTDNVQQGDQNAPDAPAAHKTKTSPKTASETETPVAETENNADGPGGHQDLPGNVDHQFDGQH